MHIGSVHLVRVAIVAVQGDTARVQLVGADGAHIPLMSPSGPYSAHVPAGALLADTIGTPARTSANRNEDPWRR